MSDEKKLASLKFDVSKAQTQLNDLSEIINTLSENSEKKFQGMAQNIEKSFSKLNFGNLDLNKLNSSLKKSESLSQKTLEKMIVNNNNAQNKITVNTEKETQRRLTNEENYQQKANLIILKASEDRIAKQQEYNLKSDLSNQKLSEKMILQEQKTQKSLSDITENGLLDRLKKYGEFYLSFNGFDQLKQSAIDFVETMKSVETRMTEISRIMEDGSIDVQNYRDELIQLAYDYGRTFDEASTVTLNFAKAGYDANDSIAMTEKSLLALNTAELDADQATDGLISIMAQWGLNTGTTTEKAKNLEAVIDKINKTADNFPITSEGLLEALKRTSQGFNLAGASIDETIALIVSAETAAQRGGKEIGTAMANMIQQLKAEGKLNLAEELGLDFYEDEAKTTFKSITDIFAEMSEMMSKLKSEGKESSVEMQSLLELFTVFRRNVGAGLLSEMEGEDSTYVKALETSMNSLNYSVEENSKYMNTAEAATKKFEDTLLQLQATIWNKSGEGFFYAIINSGESLIKSLNKIIDKFGAVPTAIGAATLAYTAFNKQIQTQIKFSDGKMNFGISGNIKNKIQEVSEQVKMLKSETLALGNANTKASETFTKYIEEVGVANVTTKGYIASLAKQKAATVASQIATAALQTTLSIGLSVAMTALIALITNLINKQKNYIESNNEIIQTSKDKIQELENEDKTISEVIAKYEELGKKEIRTPETNKEILSLQEQIKESLGSQADSIDLLNGRYDEQINKLNKILEKNAELEIENAKSANVAAQANYDKGTSQFVNNNLLTGKEQEQINIILESAQNLDDAYTKLKEHQKELNDEVSNLNQRIAEGSVSKNSTYLQSLNTELQLTTNVMSQIKERIDAVTDSEDKLNNLLAKQYFAKNIQGNVSSLADFQEKINEINQLPLMEGFKGNIEDQKKLLKSLISQEYPELAQKLNELNANKFEEDFKKNANGIKDSITSITEKLKGLNADDILNLENYGTDEQKEVFKSLQKSADEYGVSISSLISKLTELGLVQGSVSESTSSFKSVTDQIKDALDSENTAFDALETAMNTYNENGKLTNEEVMTMLKNSPELAKYLVKVGDSYKLNENALKDYNEAQKNTNTLVDEYISKLQEEQFGTKEFAKTYNEFIDAINKKYDFESIKSLSGQVKEINQSFLDGKTTTIEYFNALQKEIANIGEIKIIDGEQASEEIEGMQAVFASFTQSTVQGIEYIQAQFESGQMNFKDYSLSMQEATENIIDLYTKANDLQLNDQTQEWAKTSGGAIDEYATSLQQAKNELEAFNEVLNSMYNNSEFLKNSLTEFGTVAIDSAQVGTDAYNNYVNSFVSGLDYMVGRNDDAYNAIVDAVEGVVGYTINTSDELRNAIAGNAEALSAATNESASQTGTALGSLTKSAGNVISALGKTIANFNYSINIIPSGSLKFSLKNLLAGGDAFKGSGLKLRVHGEGGSSVSQLAGALQTFGKDLSSLNLGSVDVGKILNAGSYNSSGYNRPYTPISSGRSSRGSGSSGNSGSSGSGRSSSTAEKNTILQDFKDAISEREKEEQRWVNKQKELNELSLNDQKYILQQEIDRYKKYADEVMQLTGVTEEEKLKVRKEYLQKAEDLELDYIGLLEEELNDAIDAIKKKYDERIDKINETADAEIEALQKVEDENDRIRAKEEYLANRDEIIHGNQGIEYWEQRTGREAQLALAEAKKKLEDLDKEWKEKEEGWNTEDQIQAIKDRRDAEIEAANDAMEAEISAIQATYDYRVKQFAETGKMIFDEATIQSKALYDTYKKNFVDPIGSELRDALSKNNSTQTSSASSSRNYTIQWGDTLTSIANRFGTTISKIMAANPWITNANRIYAGNTIKIPSSHTGSKVLGDGLVNLQAGEIVLNTKWARDLDRMLEAYARPSSNNTYNNSTNSTANNVNVKGNMIQIDAKIEDKSDINTLTRKIERTLKKKFDIN